MNKQGIEIFARDILGCGCSAEVFESIEKFDTVLVGGAGLLNHKIIIGKRLLIYLWQTDKTLDENKLKAMIEAGITERNNKNYNRFRLALLSGPSEIPLEIGDRALAAAEGKDEKVHLHYLTPADMEGIELG